MNPTGSGRQRRVAIVVSSLNSGGAERAALNLAAASTRSLCTVVAERRAGDLRGDPHAHEVVYVSDDARPRGRGERIIRLMRTLRPVRPDVVVSMLSPIVTVSAARLLRRPVVHWLQAPWSETTRVTAPTVEGRLHRQALRAAISGSAMVAATTPGLCDECIGLGLPQRKLALLPNGLHLPAEAMPRRHRPSRPTIITVGRLEPPKRHDLVLRAVAELGDAVRLVIVGSGRDEATLRELATALDLGDRVQFTGFVADPYRQLQQADLFVLATDYEGFGNVIVEALAAGLPVVVSDVPHGPRFILADGRYGALVPPNSAASLAQEMRRALDSAPLEARSAAEARARAESFDVARIISRFEQLMDVVEQRAPIVPEELRRWD